MAITARIQNMGSARRTALRVARQERCASATRSSAAVSPVLMEDTHSWRPSNTREAIAVNKQAIGIQDRAEGTCPRIRIVRSTPLAPRRPNDALASNRARRVIFAWPPAALWSAAAFGPARGPWQRVQTAIIAGPEGWTRGGGTHVEALDRLPTLRAPTRRRRGGLTIPSASSSDWP